jgi:hypothetical protein
MDRRPRVQGSLDGDALVELAANLQGPACDPSVYDKVEFGRPAPMIVHCAFSTDRNSGQERATAWQGPALRGDTSDGADAGAELMFHRDYSVSIGRKLNLNVL